MLFRSSAHRTFKGEITIKDNFLVINGSKIRITSYESPKDINWADVNAQYIAECTGRFLTKELASQHIIAGAKKVVMSAPSKDDTPMFVCGVNLDEYNGDDIVSNASCTTNCLAPIVKVIHDNIGIESGLMTTVHPITASQSNIDIYSKRDYRAGRAGLNNIIQIGRATCRERVSSPV